MRLAYLAAAVLAVFAFAFRLLTLSSLSNDHYLYLAWAQQMVLGELPGRDFVEPGMPLQIAISALGQAWAAGPSTEGAIAIAMLALAAAATCIGVASLTGSAAAGIAASLFQILAQPRLYSYPKILVPAVLLVLAVAYARRPRGAVLLLLAAWVAVAFLLRHDIGGYAALASVAVVTLSHRTFREALSACARLTIAVLLILLPYFVFLEWNGGLVEHARGALEYTKSETHLWEFDWPVFGFGASRPENPLPWDADDAAAFFFYAGFALPVLSLLLLVRGPADAGHSVRALEDRRDVVVRAAVAGLVVMGACYAAVLLRYPLVSRVQDLAAIYAILGAWVAVALIRMSEAARHGVWRAAARAIVAAVILVAAVSIDVIAEVRVMLADARLLDAPPAMRERMEAVMREGREWPWSEYWPAGDLPSAVRYLTICTDPGDRVLVTWPAPEYYVFARRGFAAGHANFLAPRAYTGDADQALMVSRLEQHQPPVVLINESRRPEFSAAYPRVDEYLREHYTPAGEFTIRDSSTVSIGARRGFSPVGVYGDGKWPCRLRP
jgi:hypothetical protein